MNPKEPSDCRDELNTPAERPVGYRRPQRNRKKKRFLGAIALGLTLASFLLLIAVCASAFIKYRGGTLGGGDIRLLKTAAIISVSAASLAALIAIVTLFLRRQKKGMAVASLILALLTVALCGAGLYAYQYTLGNLREDADFNDLSKEDLNVVTVASDGELIRQTQEPSSTMASEELEQLIGTPEELYEATIEWEAIDYNDIPAGAREKMDSKPPEEPSYLLKNSNQITNYLLFGVDKGNASDSIILLSFDRVHHKIKMISLARDSYVMVPEWGSYVKLAYPYHWGGAEMATRIINYNFYLNVEDYIAVDFDQLEEIVDLVGGVDVELDADEAYYLRNAQSGLTVGKNHLYGRAALLYARTRKSSANDNEIKRTARQREVLMSIMSSVHDMRMADYPHFIRSCMGMCTTSLTAEELLDLALQAALGDYTIESYSLLEMDGVDFWGGVFGEEQYFYCVYDLSRASDCIYRVIYEDLYLSSYDEKHKNP